MNKIPTNKSFKSKHFSITLNYLRNDESHFPRESQQKLIKREGDER